MGIFDALNTSVGGSAGAVLRAAEHFRQHRERLDHRLQGHRHQLRGSDPGRHDAQQAGRRRRRRLLAGHHHHPGHGLGLDGRHQHGDQRRRLLLGAEADLDHRQRAGVRRRHRLHPPRRFPGQRQRQPRQRRRLLSDGRRPSIPRPATRPATCRRCCNSRTTSSRRRRRPPSPMPRTCRPSRRRRQARRLPPIRSPAPAASTPPTSPPIRWSLGTPAPPVDASRAGTVVQQTSAGDRDREPAQRCRHDRNATRWPRGSRPATPSRLTARPSPSSAAPAQPRRQTRSTSPTMSATLLSKIAAITGATADPRLRRRITLHTGTAQGSDDQRQCGPTPRAPSPRSASPPHVQPARAAAAPSARASLSATTSQPSPTNPSAAAR